MTRSSYADDSATVRAILREYLELLRDYVAAGEEHIAEQKELISRLRPDSRATIGARDFLRDLEQIQAMRVTHRDRLERELATAAAE